MRRKMAPKIGVTDGHRIMTIGGGLFVYIYKSEISEPIIIRFKNISTYIT